MTTKRRVGTLQLDNTFPKRESIVVKFQKKYEMCYCILSRIPITIEPFIFMENVLSSFDRILTTWTLKFFLRKEPEIIFFYRSMIDNSS